MASSGVMVGRAAELATVRSLVDGVRRGRGGFLLVSGEAGIGKTRLLREAAERARDAGLAVVSGRAVEGGGTYRPLTEALVGHLREAWPASSEESSCRVVLGRLLPGWAGDGGMSLNVDPALVLSEAVLSLLRVGAVAHPHPPVEVTALAQATRGLRHLLSRDLPAASALLDDGMSKLDGRGEAGPVQHWGLWALLRTMLADRDAEARETLRRSPAVLRVVNRAGLQYADAVAEARAGRPARAAALFAAADQALAEHHWWRRLLRLFALEAAIADGWGEPIGALRADLEAHVRIGETQLARTCRDLLRSAGAPTRRGRGLAQVPSGLRAAGVTSREMDVLGLVAEGLTNRKIAERLFISPRTVDTHVASLLAKTGAADRTELRTAAQRH